VDQTIHLRILCVIERIRCYIVSTLPLQCVNDLKNPFFIGGLIASKGNQLLEIRNPICSFIFLHGTFFLDLTDSANRIRHHVVDHNFAPVAEERKQCFPINARVIRIIKQKIVEIRLIQLGADGFEQLTCIFAGYFDVEVRRFLRNLFTQ